MSDYFSNLGLELQRAAARSAARRGRVPRAVSWVASHIAISVIGGAVVAGGAGAAALALRTSNSDGPRGSVVTATTAAGQSSVQYELSVFPSLKVGTPGWCTSLSLQRSADAGRVDGAGCGPAASNGEHQFAAGYVELGGDEGRLTYALVDEAVGYARLDSGAHLIPRADPRLPGGWRILITGPQQGSNGSLPLFTPAGQPLRTNGANHRVDAQPIEFAAGPVPAGAACSFAIPEGATARQSRWLTRPEPSGELSSPAYLPCAQTSLRYHAAWSEVTILLDAADPGTALPADLPGNPNESGLVEIPAYSASYGAASGTLSPIDPLDQAPGNRATAKRVGMTWVVVRARTQDQRHQILEKLSLRENVKTDVKVTDETTITK